MPKLGEAGFVLTLREFVFLAALTGAENIYGVEDDTYKLSQEELQEEWNKIKGQLENKNYLEIDIDGSITIDDDLFEMIHHCCNPRLFMKCNGKGLGEKTFNRCYYISIDHSVELDQDRLMKNTYALTPMKDMDKMIDNLKECYLIKGDYESTEISFEVAFDEFQQITEQIDMSKEEAINKIVSLGCTKEAAIDFYGAYRNKKKYIISFIANVSNQDIKDVSTFYILGGQKYLWKTSDITSENDNITVSVSDIKDIDNQIYGYIDEIKKIYL
ncbi:hypothetical protein SH1V18_11010 [Vallitalea longa]|uniref:Uncharacterized protein n=1 Tax=Vallitalea longa TaxID=2936439 RepID=A0A9W6DDD2_9FIRM|nr:hypothetical protein [Vallitalea longa]GKX28621.1 hypothetical protein SH1V18_11010 [Vallitalea longa]